jgi:hypothetical protein
VRNTRYRSRGLLWRALLLNALFLASSATYVSAHETLPSEWCIDPGTEPHILSEFEFSPDELQAYAERNSPKDNLSSDTGPEYPNHGIVDRWYWANQMSHAYCAAIGRSAMPFVIRPVEFNDPQNHHESYNFDNPLIGVCVVCVPGK